MFLFFVFCVCVFLAFDFLSTTTAIDLRLRRMSIPDCIRYIFVLS